MKIFYTTRATATGGRSGHTALDDGSLAFDLASPGSDHSGANPEQLFAMGYAACFDSAVDLCAKKLKLPLTVSHTSVAVGIGQTAEGGYKLDAEITLRTEGLSTEQAQQLIEAAHQVCPYSNATRGNIDVRLQVDAA